MRAFYEQRLVAAGVDEVQQRQLCWRVEASDVSAIRRLPRDVRAGVQEAIRSRYLRDLACERTEFYADAEVCVVPLDRRADGKISATKPDPDVRSEGRLRKDRH